MKNVFSKVCSTLLATLATLPALTWSLTVPNADTPVFYLVSSSASNSSNLKPLRHTDSTGSGNGVASLLGSGAPAQFYFYQGYLSLLDPNGSDFPFRPLINTQQTGVGTCADFGALVLIQGGSTNKCATSNWFQIQSNGQNSQLGAELVFNYVGGFYSCSSGQEVWYKIDPTDGPSGCDLIHLWTVPVV